MGYENRAARAALGAIAGMSTTALIPSAVSYVAGISAVGPVAGGVFSLAQSAGYTLPFLQTVAMAGVALSTKAVGGIVGTYLFSRL